jgi:hypothetical protein
MPIKTLHFPLMNDERSDQARPQLLNMRFVSRERGLAGLWNNDVDRPGLFRDDMTFGTAILCSLSILAILDMAVLEPGSEVGNALLLVLHH